MNADRSDHGLVVLTLSEEARYVLERTNGSMQGSERPSQVVSLSMGLSQSTVPGQVNCQHLVAETDPSPAAVSRPRTGKQVAGGAEVTGNTCNRSQVTGVTTRDRHDFTFTVTFRLTLTLYLMVGR